MFGRTSEKVVDHFVNTGVVTNDDRELYQYGLNQGLTIVLNIVTTLVIGLLLNMVWQSILFMIAYIPIRTYAGGYHARTPLKCYIISVIMIIAVLLVIKFIVFSIIPFTVFTITSALIIVILAPVADANKPLEDIESKVYKRKTLVFLAVEIFITIGLIIFGLVNIAVCIASALIVLSVMLGIGVINNSKQKK
jgi:accessory gene regulator B